MKNNEALEGKIEAGRPSVDDEHENLAAGDDEPEIDLDAELDPSPVERADGAAELRLDP